jgi:hypothetical protein
LICQGFPDVASGCVYSRPIIRVQMTRDGQVAAWNSSPCARSSLLYHNSISE